MNFSFPKTKFFLENSRDKQLEHVFEEAGEIVLALQENEPTSRVDEEIMDLTHSLETFWRIVERESGAEYVADLRQQVFMKNMNRNYYPSLGVKK